MKIKDISNGGKVAILVEKGEESAQFESLAVFGDEMGLFIEPIKVDGDIVNFDVSDNVKISVIIVNTDNLPYEWEYVIIKALNYKNEQYHLIITDKEVDKMNRRSGYRLFLGVDASVRFGENKAAKEVTIKDISETGIAFLSDEDLDVKENSTVYIKFTDNKTNTKFNLRANVVRKVESNGRTLYGCKLIERSDSIYKFIVQRQRDFLSRNSKRYRKGV